MDWTSFYYFFPRAHVMRVRAGPATELSLVHACGEFRCLNSKQTFCARPFDINQQMRIGKSQIGTVEDR